MLRRKRDSNPRYLAVQRFSRPPHSTTLPPLRSGVGLNLIGRAGGIRTPNRRFWRPLLYQLNYRPTQGSHPFPCAAPCPTRKKRNHSTTSATRPEPIVRPPSRMAKVNPCSIATGLPNSTETVTRSPRITISMLSSRVNDPVTSVVLK